MLKAVNPAGSAWPGASMAVLANGSGFFVSSGHVGLDERGDIVSSSLEAQIVALFEGMSRTLKAAGLAFEHVARITYYVTDYEPALVDVLRAVRNRYLNQELPPATVLVGVAALYDPRIRIEAEMIAIAP